MIKYRRSETVDAAQITAVAINPMGDIFVTCGGSKYKIKDSPMMPVPGDYLVQADDGSLLVVANGDFESHDGDHTGHPI